MRQIRLGRSAVTVTELTLGTAGIGNLYAPISDETAAGAVQAAWDEGIRSFDTAPHYGLGLAERRLGAALRRHPRDEYVISTKVGRILEPVENPGADDLEAGGFAVPGTFRRRWDFSADGVRRSLEVSLERLGHDHVDVALLHDPDDHEKQAFAEAYPALEQLRAEGVVRAIGVGMNQSAMPARFVRETDIDVVLLAGRYTLLDQGGLDDLLPAAAERGVAVLAGGVFNSGLLADPKPGATFNYTAAPAELVGRALRMKEVCDARGGSLRAAALRFPLGHPAVAGVVIGSRTADEVRDSLRQFGAPLDAGFWNSLRAAGLLPGHVPVPGPLGSGAAAEGR
ncbi:MAG TPA: aldo/keto reductase [Actinocrinis sp.]